MGINQQIVEFEKEVLESAGLKYEGLNWCELGNQRINKDTIAKHKYAALGVNHVSIDLNGRDGALPIDLDYPMPFFLIEQFDVITNYGTIEHVNNQFQVFKNAHDLCKKEGIMIHLFPYVGNWPEHCRYYYSKEFLIKLANACKYQVIKRDLLETGFFRKPKNILVVAYKKKSKQFITKEEFSRIADIKDTGNLAYTGNYKEKDILCQLKNKIIKYILKPSNLLKFPFQKLL